MNSKISHECQSLICSLNKEKLISSAEFILTDRCNLKCKYCYSANTSRTQTISKGTIRIVIEFLFKNAYIRKMLGLKSFVDISFLGGGEPTLAWDELMFCVEYIKNKSRKLNIDFNLSITTNGTLSAEKTKYLVSENFVIKVSLDGVQSVNSYTRVDENGENAYEKISNTLDILNTLHGKFKIGAVVCAENFNYMYQFAEYITQRWPNVLCINFSYLQNTETSKKNNISRINYISFLNEIEHCYQLFIHKKIGIFKNYTSIHEYRLKNIYIPCPKATGDKIVVNCDNLIYNCSHILSKDTQCSVNREKKRCFDIIGKNIKCDNCQCLKYCMLYNANCVKSSEYLLCENEQHEYCEYIRSIYSESNNYIEKHK